MRIPYAVHADGVFEILLTIQTVALSKELNDFLIRRQADNCCCFVDTHAVVDADLAIGGTDGYHPFGVQPRNVGTIDIGRRPGNMNARDSLGFGQRLGNRLGNIVNVRHHPLTHP